MKTEIVIAVDDQEVLDKGAWSELVKARAGWCCEKCGRHRDDIIPKEYVDGRSRRKIESHHKNRDETDHRLANGECLCFDCHNLDHKEERAARIVAYNKSERGRARSSEILTRVRSEGRGGRRGGSG